MSATDRVIRDIFYNKHEITYKTLLDVADSSLISAYVIDISGIDNISPNNLFFNALESYFKAYLIFLKNNKESPADVLDRHRKHNLYDILDEIRENDNDPEFISEVKVKKDLSFDELRTDFKHEYVWLDSILRRKGDNKYAGIDLEGKIFLKLFSRSFTQIPLKVAKEVHLKSNDNGRGSYLRERLNVIKTIIVRQE